MAQGSHWSNNLSTFTIFYNFIIVHSIYLNDENSAINLGEYYYSEVIANKSTD